MKTERTIEDIFSGAESVSLRSREKETIRQHLISFMERQPVSSMIVPRHNIWTLKAFIFKPMMVPIALLIVVFAGSGVSFAAEQALPGDLFYPVKISVNEEVRAAFAVASGDEADWDLRRLERRLEESEQLVVRYGSLSSEHAEAFVRVQSNFDAHAERVRAHIEEFEEQGDVHSAAELSSNLEVSLFVHERILARLAEDAENDETVLALSNAVDIEGQAVSSTRISAERRAVMGAHTESRTAAEGRMKGAEHKIAEVRDFLEKQGGHVDAEASAEAALRLGEAETTLVAGKEKLTAEAFNEAFLLFQQAHRTAQQAKLLLIAHTSFAIDVEFHELEDGDQEDDEAQEENGDAHEEDEDLEQIDTSEEPSHEFEGGEPVDVNGENAGGSETETEGESRFHLRLPPIL